jgi:hypothetical protein
VVVPVPILRRRPGGRRFRFDARQRYTKRLARGRKARAPGDLVQIDTLFVNVRPDRAIKHFTAYDPIAKWTIGHVATNASAKAARDLLDKLIARAPFKVRGIQVDGGSEFMSVFEDHCRDKVLNPDAALAPGSGYAKLGSAGDQWRLGCVLSSSHF